MEPVEQGADTEMDLSESFMNAGGEGDANVEPPKDENVSRETEKVDEKAKDAPADDPDVEMDWEEQPGQKAKLKMSELKANAKWLKENEQMIAGTLKIREESQKNPSFGKALSAIISKAYNEKGEFQSEAVDGILANLEAKKEAIQEKVDDKTDDIKEMEDQLSELDPESPHAKILQRNIQATKGLRQQLATALEQTKKMEERLNGLDKFKTELVDKETKAVTGEKVKQLSTIYDREVGALTDAAKSDGYKFIDDAEKSDFDRAVRDAVASKAQAIKTDEEFVKAIKDSAKAIYESMTKRREAYIADYLRKKNGEQKPGVAKVEPVKDRSFTEMGDMLADGMMNPPATQ